MLVSFVDIIRLMHHFCNGRKAFRLKATYFWYSPKVGKNEFKGEDFDFFPLENPLIKTTGRGPVGPLAGHPPSGTPATNYWRKCTTIRRTLTGTKTRGGALGSCTFIGTRVVFKGGAAI